MRSARPQPVNLSAAIIPVLLAVVVWAALFFLTEGITAQLQVFTR